MHCIQSIFKASLPFLVLTAGTLKSESQTSQSSAPTDDIVAALPVIPDAKFNLADYGAVGDNRTDNTDAFHKAVAAIEAAGGGHLTVPAGTYKTRPFTLTSHMDLHLDPGSKIKAPDNFADYGLPDPNDAPAGGGGRGGFGGGRSAPLISGNNLTDVAITGSGTIDGSGQRFWIWSDKAARLYPPGRTVIGRPTLVNISGNRLHFDGVMLTNSPMYNLVPHGSNITIENLRIVDPSDSPNTDAMDPSGDHIIIRNCDIDVGDDHIALQSGSHDILVTNLTCLHGHGISIGSHTSAGLYHIIVRDCNFIGSDNGIRIKSHRGDAGEVHDIWYSNITMKDVKRPFDINTRYLGNSDTALDVGPRSPEGQPTTALPDFHDIHVSNLTITRSPLAGRILGIPEQMPHDITFTNVTIHSDHGFLIQDAGANITFENSKIDASVGDPFVMDNATFKWNGVDKTGTSGGSPELFYLPTDIWQDRIFPLAPQ